MNVGVSTACLYPMETDKALDTLLRLGFRDFEVFLNTFSELEPAFIRELRGRADAAGGRIISVHPFTSGIETTLFFSAYAKRFHDGQELYKRYYQAAAQLGASYLVLHGQNKYRQGDITEEEYIDRYYAMRELGKTFGVTLAQENVNRFRSETASFIRRMHEQLGKDCSFVLDIKQAFRAGQDPIDMVRAMGDGLVHVHINDRAPGEECLLPGQGDFDYGALSRELKDIGYRGHCIIEVYRDNFIDTSELIAAKEFLMKS